VALGLYLGLKEQAEAQYAYTTLCVPGSNFTQALGINASGQIVGCYFDAVRTLHGFLLHNGSYRKSREKPAF